MIKKTWEKRSHGDFATIWDAFTYWNLKRRYLQSGLLKFFTVCNFGNILAMTIIFLFQIDVAFRNWTKIWDNIFRFSGNCIWIGSCKFLQSWTGYSASAVNVLTNTPKISPKTTGDIFQINFPENDEKHDKSALTEISQVFGTLWHVDCQSLFWNTVL